MGAAVKGFKKGDRVMYAGVVLKIPNIIATASRPETIKWVLAHGATHMINHQEALATQIEQLELKVPHILISYRTEAYFAACLDLVQPFVELPIPTPGPGELLVRIMAFSVNPVDTKIRQGKAPYAALHGKDKPLGFDASGVVAKRGPKCKRFDVGDAVMYAGVIGKSGTYAQYGIIDERLVGKKPKTLTFTMAAGLPLVSLTAWEALVERLALPLDPPAPRKDSIMIINASGGVGTMATQIARRLLRFDTVIATASQPHTIEWCKQFYATHCVNYRDDIKAQLSGLGLVVNNIMMCYSPDVYL
ncbi:hypothetical protein BZG36_01333 [Bifiguratus adelaidae]|uniref:Enoyl reductase (ER) domain-containing protein n=1 Tax=Bifiguratus adelaidae TaxID=1938954 RepID=A0A261Y537_9FUNG|nr:hypothetical protein BZG36_01333 [Bifiguratus adelaidae]